MDKGAFGEIYECLDLYDKNALYVIKLGPKGRMMKNEIRVLKAIKSNEEMDKYRYPYDYVPQVIDSGHFEI